MTADGKFISEVIKNKKDHFLDFPDSSYKIGSLELPHLREALTKSQENGDRPIKIVVPDTVPFATWVPILATIKYAGYSSTLIENPNGLSTQIHFLPKTSPEFTAPSPNARPKPFACIILSTDSIFLQKTCNFFWAFSPSKDSARHLINLGFRALERIQAMPTKYPSEDLDRVTRSLLEKIKDSTSTLHFAVFPTVLAKDFLRFHHDLDSSSTFQGKGFVKHSKVLYEYPYALDGN